MREIVLKGHKVSRGKAEGEALVCQSPISFMHGVNPETGIIVEKAHELEGESITDKVLIFPFGKGSTAGSYQIYELSICNKAPKAIINLRADPVIAVGAIMSNIPMVDRLDENPLKKIQSGDLVEVDADTGVVIVKAPHPSPLPAGRGRG